MKNNKRRIHRIISIILVSFMVFGMLPQISLPASAQMSYRQLTDANIVAVAVGSYHQLALDDEGRVWAWGENTNYKQGLGPIEGTRYPRLVTQTNTGAALPKIKQISAGYQNSLLLDVNGTVWSAGGGAAYSNGDSAGTASYFKRVVLGTDANKAIYVSSGHFSGLAIDQDGHLWYWGQAANASSGLGNNNAVTTPTRIDVGTSNLGNASDATNNISITDKKFVACAISDYYPTTGATAIALTDNGEIWTWGLGSFGDNMLAVGGSYRPKQVTSVASTSSIRELPTNIVKIDTGIGSFGMLDADGHLWTWGANYALAANGGMLGQGMTGAAPINTSNSIRAPKVVDYIKTSNSASPTAAPKFADFGMFAWNSHAVDDNGNIYATGELLYNSDIGVGTYKNYFTKGTLPTDAKAAKLVATSSGHYGAVLFIDVNGNVWEQGSYTGGTSSALTLANFTQSRALFKSLSGTDTTTTQAKDSSGNPLYDGQGNPIYEKKIIYKDKYLDGTTVANVADAGATLTAQVSTPSGYTLKEVQYVELYDDDPYYQMLVDQFNGRLGTWGNEVVLNNSNGNILASKSYPYFSQYVSDWITDSIFNDMFSTASSTTTRRSGTMTASASTGTYTTRVYDNCIVVAQTVTYKNGTSAVTGPFYTTRMSYEFSTFLTPIRLYQKGVKESYKNDNFDATSVTDQEDAVFSFGLYGAKAYSGVSTRLYGLYYDHDGTFNEERSIDTITVYPDAVPYWMVNSAVPGLDPTTTNGVTFTLNSEAYQELPTAERLAKISAADSSANYCYDTDSGIIYYKAADGKYYALVTYQFIKDPTFWAPVDLYYVDNSLQEIDVLEDDGSDVRTNPESLGSFAPTSVPFVQGHDPYTPPAAQDTATDYQPIGYIIVTKGANPSTGTLVECSFPSGFNPTVSTNQDIYIVYTAGLKTITEHFSKDTWDGQLVSPNSSMQVQAGNNYGAFSASQVSGYVAVSAYAKEQGGTRTITVTEQTGVYGDDVQITIQDVQNPWDVYYIYKVDANNNGIPDEYEGQLNVRWVGIYEDGSTALLGTEAYIGDGNVGDTSVFTDDDGENHGATWTSGSLSWIFNSSATTKAGWSAASDALNLNFPEFDITYQFEPNHKTGTLTFYYDIDANGNGVADKDEGLINEQYRLIDGGLILDDNDIPLISDTTKKMIEGDTYNKAAPYIPGYVGIQVKVDTYTNVARTNLNEGNRENTLTASINPVDKFGHLVTFYYMVDADGDGVPDELQGQVTVQWVAITTSGAQVVMNKVARTGIGVDTTDPSSPWYQHGLDFRPGSGTASSGEFAPSSQWLFDDGSNDTPQRDVAAEYGYTGQWYFDYTFNHDEPQVLNFYYDEDYNENQFPDRLEPMVITVIGKVGDTELYNYIINKGLNDRPFDVTAFPQTTYKLVSSQALQFTDPGNGSTKPVNDLAAAAATGLTETTTVAENTTNPKLITVDPRLGHQTVVFEYASNMTMVTIEAYYGDSTTQTTTSVEGFTSFQVPAEIGKAFSYQAPAISGHTNTLPSGGTDTIASVSATPTDNVIKFYYTRDTGALTVIAKEDGTNIEIGRVGRQIANGAPVDTTYANVPTATEIPALTNYELVANSGTASSSIYDGINNVTLTYLYKRITRDITIEAYDAVTNRLIGSVAAAPYGVGSYHDISAPDSTDITALSNYELIGDDHKDVYVSNTEITGITIKFYYRQTSGGEVTVIAYWLEDDGVTEHVLQQYTTPYATGVSVNVNAPTLAGWQLATEAPDNVSPVNVTPGSTTETVKFRYVSDMSAITIKLQDNATPANDLSGLVSGFIATHDAINGTSFTVYAPHIPGYVIYGDSSKIIAVSGEETITFTYQPLEEVIDQYTVAVTVKGVEQGTSRELYSYVVYKAKNSGDFSVDALGVNGYKLETASPATVTVEASPIIQTFEYTSLSATVTIKAVDGDNNPISGFTPIIAPATIGQPFSYNAPYILGWNLNGDITQTITSVDTTNNTLTFVYDAASGNVTIVLKENDTNGRVIKTQSANLTAANSPLAIDIPDLSGEYYTLVPGQSNVPVSYDGTAKTVEYYYTKDIRDVDIAAYDVTNPGSPVQLGSAITQGSYRIGETANFAAPMQDGYELVSTTPQTVIVTSGTGSQQVSFDYTTLAQDDLSVQAVDENDNILQTYTLKGTVGQAMTVPAPAIMGYKLIVGESSTKSGTVPGIITFRYVKDVVTVTVEIKDNADTDLTALVPGVATSYEVARNTDFTAYAPHVPGYVLMSAQSVTYSTISDDKTATFTYQPLEEVIDQYTVAVTVKGVEQGTSRELYSYVVYKAKNSGVFTAQPFTQPNYTLCAVYVDGTEVTSDATVWDASTQTLTLNVATTGYDVTFNYRSLEAKVLVRMLDDATGNEIFPSFLVNAMEGQLFTYNAPDVSTNTTYYYFVRQMSDNPVTTSTIGRIDSVSGDGTSEIVFYYNTVTSGVILIAKEGNADGRVLLVQNLDSSDWTSNNPQTIEIPDLSGDYYAYNRCDANLTDNGDGTVILVYDSTAALQIVEVYYDKELMNIPIVAIENGTDNVLDDAQVVTGARIGEAVPVYAPTIDNYKLVSNSVQMVLAVPEVEVVFYYEKVATEGTMTIKVTASSNENTISGATVTVKDSAGTTVAIAQTNASGIIELTDLPFGVYSIQVTARDYNSSSVSASISSSQQNAYVVITMGTTGGGGAITPTTTHTVTYNANGGTGNDYKVAGINSDSSHLVLTIAATGISRAGYVFEGWNTAANGSGMAYAPGATFKVSGDITLYAQWKEGTLLEQDNHIVYLQGYADGSVGADKAITRAEAAAIFYRLLTNKGNTEGGRFTDVQGSEWYAQAINYLASIGILKGYPDGTFKPNAPITRAEFATIASRFDSLAATGSNVFSDVPGSYWAVSYINSAYAKGWINGYPDGTFSPEKDITRAEVVKIVNAMLNRAIDSDALVKVINPYNDIKSSHWAYACIIEASISHEFVRDANGKEIWRSW